MSDNRQRDSMGRWVPGKSANPATQWGPNNPPPKSPGRPRKDAWVEELVGRLDDPRIRQALADKLLRTALKGGERASLQAINLIQDRIGGPVVRRVDAEVTGGGGVLVVPGLHSPQEWLKKVAERNALAVEPGTKREESDTPA